MFGEEVRNRWRLEELIFQPRIFICGTTAEWRQHDGTDIGACP